MRNTLPLLFLFINWAPSLGINVPGGYPPEILQPSVTCTESKMTVVMNDVSATPVSIAAQGFEYDSICTAENTRSISLNFDSCGVKKVKSGSLTRFHVCLQVGYTAHSGVAERTYCGDCFSRGAAKSIRLRGFAWGDVKSVAKGDEPIWGDFHRDVPKLPHCSYTIRKQTPLGPQVQFATIGDRIYHVWSCDSDFYGSRVQNCFVEDGQNNKILIVDNKGCGVDPYIMQTPLYNDDMNKAYQESHVFKFAGKTVAKFTCQIRHCLKLNGSCDEILPPHCVVGSANSIRKKEPSLNEDGSHLQTPLIQSQITYGYTAEEKPQEKEEEKVKLILPGKQIMPGRCRRSVGELEENDASISIISQEISAVDNTDVDIIEQIMNIASTTRPCSCSYGIFLLPIILISLCVGATIATCALNTNVLDKK